MTTKHLFLAGFAMLFFSCSDDDNNVATAADQAVFDYFTTDISQVSDGRTQRTYSKTTLQDQKLFAVTEERFINGQSQGEFSEQRYFYENGLLVKKVISNDVMDFFYDTQGRMIAINWTYGQSPSVTRYYRFTHLPQQKVYFEYLTLPYDDPETAVSKRIVIAFDSNDNIVKAGVENLNSGVIMDQYLFAYDADGNLIKTTSSTGGEAVISYAPIKDNMAKILINTFGKRNFMVYQAECYIGSPLIESLRHSPNLRTTDLQESVFESGPSSYYFRKTQEVTTDRPYSKVTTFYFK